ncbi:hypothetical protein ACQP1G_23320 [Nocardia sp. CA-107356]|uniref:hypothetical protein n=1 Tax=Nocardia sp. CA-107356 TaxID=3239972 RepID=UPI003D89F908
MLIAALIVATIGLMRRRFGRRRAVTESGPSRWRSSLRRIATSSRLRSAGPVPAAEVILAEMVWAGLVLASC